MDFVTGTAESAPAGGSLEGVDIEIFDYPTPSIVDFKNEAVVFPKAFCSSPKCIPSRWSTLTGRLGTRNLAAVEMAVQGVPTLGVAVELSRDTRLQGDDATYS